MRLFVALDIDAAIRERLARFRAEMKPLAPAARWVGAETFHVTLKFIGEVAQPRVDALRRALATVQAAPVAITFRGSGFFPNARAARVFWVGIEGGEALAALAGKVDAALASAGVAREERAFSPHLTLARAGDARTPRGASGRPGRLPGDRPNSLFAPLQQRLAQLPAAEFGAMTAAEFFLFESKLSPAGAQYSKIAGFPLPRRAG
jgi:2'-5' RNA ligase